MLSKTDKQIRINQCLKLVDPSYKLVKNYVKPHKGNTNIHEIAKFIKCLELERSNKEYYTEVRFKGGKARCDILVPEEFKIYEILASETKEECLSKIEKYPKELDVIMIVAKDLIKEGLNL